MKYKILHNIKILYPVQDNQLGTIAVKFIIYEDLTNNNQVKGICGVGTNDWVIRNGRLMDSTQIFEMMRYMKVSNHLEKF